jgi:predicted GH43/DUF377 family glycosyl hydrolase
MPWAGSVAPDAVTTPDVFIADDRYILYVGAVDSGREYITCFSLPTEYLETKSSLKVPKTTRIVLEPGPYEFNCYHVFDPAVIHWQRGVYLYYSALGKGNDTIGLAQSKDGNSFKKFEKPLLQGRSPEVLVFQEEVHLFYVKCSPLDGYRIFSATSKDGVVFSNKKDTPLLNVGGFGEWDQFEVTTPRIFERNGIFYMIYAGCKDPKRKDLPDAFGLARSHDLLYWEKYPRNPVFRIGNDGSWDDGAIWFGSVFSYRDDLFLVYEGGRLENILGKSPALTQVGLAKLAGGKFDQVTARW